MDTQGRCLTSFFTISKSKTGGNIPGWIFGAAFLVSMDPCVLASGRSGFNRVDYQFYLFIYLSAEECILGFPSVAAVDRLCATVYEFRRDEDGGASSDQQAASEQAFAEASLAINQ